MAVGDIERRQGVDGARQRLDRRRVVDHPQLVAHAVVGGDVDRRRLRGGARQQGVDHRRRRIGQHDQAGLRLDRLDLTHAVVFLHRRRQLVLADAVLGVSGDRGDRREAGLDATLPSQAVGVVARLVVAHEHALGDHAAKVLARLGVDGVVVGIDGRIEIDLGLRDVQKAPRLALGAIARLRARQHVVRRSENLRRASRRRPQSAKGLYQSQWGSLS